MVMFGLINGVLMEGFDGDNIWFLKDYVVCGGYVQLRCILESRMFQEEVISEVKKLVFCGCGGVGFFIGLKWLFMLCFFFGDKYVVCNIDEGELGIFKDCDIMCYNFYFVIEGMVIVVYVMGVNCGYNYVYGEIWEIYKCFEEVLDEVWVVGFIGQNIFGFGFNFEFFVYYGYGVYICGEEMLLFELIEGKKGQLCFKLLFLVFFGLYGKLMMINNIEIFVVILFILKMGGEEFLNLGKVNNGGIKLFLVFGYVNCFGNYEILFGMFFFMLFEMCGGMCGGCKFKVVIFGGLLVFVMLGDVIMDCMMDYDLISKGGLMLGLGVVIVMDEMVCMVKVLECFFFFYYEEFCG